jgi:acetylornithine deacetylase/succinyl-diaminopimelate desuccinylase-like protein
VLREEGRLVVGQIAGPPDAPTVLVYGHYDVQPADDAQAWTTPPFQPVVRDGRLYARGASDNKGQILAALAAVEVLLAREGRLPCNVRVLVEGEEETTTDNLDGFLADDDTRALLAADAALVTDSSVLAEGRPGVVTGLRGMVALELTVRTAAGDLHSGVWGGVAPNAIHSLAELLTGLRDPVTGRVLVEGFYDRVLPVPAGEALSWSSLPFDEAASAQALGLQELVGEAERTPWERLWTRPTLDVCGIWGGFQGDGLKAVIPAEAHAKISCRLVPEQEPQEIAELLRAHFDAHAPRGASVEVAPEVESARPFVLAAEHAAVRAALDAIRAGFGVEPVTYRAGFSVPVVDLFARRLSLDSVMLGFMHPDENMHAADEFVRLDVVQRAIRTYAAFFAAIADWTP